MATTKKKAKKRKKNFQPVKNPGAATRSAKREGLSLKQWEQKHKDDPGVTGKRARFPLIAAKWHHGGKKAKGKKNRKRVSAKAA